MEEPFYSEKPYVSVVISSTLVLDKEKNILKLNLPLKIYSQEIIRHGIDVTYRLDNLEYENKTVIAKVDFNREELREFAEKKIGTKLSDTEIESFYKENGVYIGKKWEEVKNEPEFLEHWNITKIEAFSYTDSDGNYKEYNEEDADEILRPIMWDEEVIEENEENGND